VLVPYCRTSVSYRVKHFTQKLSLVQIFVENILEMLKNICPGTLVLEGH